MAPDEFDITPDFFDKSLERSSQGLAARGAGA
jgi:hypothetical protein